MKNHDCIIVTGYNVFIYFEIKVNSDNIFINIYKYIYIYLKKNRNIPPDTKMAPKLKTRWIKSDRHHTGVHT